MAIFTHNPYFPAFTPSLPSEMNRDDEAHETRGRASNALSRVCEQNTDLVDKDSADVVDITNTFYKWVVYPNSMVDVPRLEDEGVVDFDPIEELPPSENEMIEMAHSLGYITLEEVVSNLGYEYWLDQDSKFKDLIEKYLTADLASPAHEMNFYGKHRVSCIQFRLSHDKGQSLLEPDYNLVCRVRCYINECKKVRH